MQVQSEFQVRIQVIIHESEQASNFTWLQILDILYKLLEANGAATWCTLQPQPQKQNKKICQ